MILVTGGTGMLGSFCVRELQARGERVRVLTRSQSEHVARGMGVEVAVGDLADTESLRAATKGVTGVVHVACTFSQPSVDVAAMTTLLDAWDKGAFVFISSVDVYGRVRDVPVRENAPLDGDWPYAEGKKHCEQLLAQAAERQGRNDFSILRPPNIWGPHLRCLSQKASPTFPLLERVRAGQAIVLPGSDPGEWSQFGDDWIDARELAWAAAECLVHPLGEPANAVNDHFFWNEFWTELIRLMHSNSRIEHGAAGDDFFAQRWRYSGELLQRRLDFRPKYRWQDIWAEIVALSREM